MLIQFGEAEPGVDWFGIGNHMQIVVVVINYFVARLVCNEGVADGSFIGYSPVKCLGARRHCVNNQPRQKVAQVSECFAYASAGNTTVDREEVLSPTVHSGTGVLLHFCTIGHLTLLLANLFPLCSVVVIYCGV